MTHEGFASVELPHSTEGSAQQSAVEVAEWPVGATLFASDVHCGSPVFVPTVDGASHSIR